MRSHRMLGLLLANRPMYKNKGFNDQQRTRYYDTGKGICQYRSDIHLSLFIGPEIRLAEL